MKHSVKEEFYKTLYNQPMESKEILCSSDIMEKIFSLESVDRGPDKFDLQSNRIGFTAAEAHIIPFLRV